MRPEVSRDSNRFFLVFLHELAEALADDLRALENVYSYYGLRDVDPSALR